MFLFAIYLAFLTTLFVIGAEIVVRKKGWRPWDTQDLAVEVTPGGKFFRKDAILGYTHIPGHYTVTLEDGYTFEVTNLPNTLRVTHPADAASAGRPEIWIFGCSYTYGWTLNDEETYAWRVQESLPGYEVVNHGVNGYGQIHALLQMQTALEEGTTPAAAVVTYAGFHDERNTFSRSRRKAVAPWNKLGPLVQPYARLSRDGRLQFSNARVEFVPFPFMRISAFAHYIELKLEALEQRVHRSHEVTEAIIVEMATLAREHNFTLVVAGISDDVPTRDILQFAEEKGISAVDMSTDLSAPGYRNLPHDRHPSALANREFARKLTESLRKTGAVR